MARSIIILSLAALALAAPARATGGMTCRTAGPHVLELRLVVGHTIVPSLVSARLFDGGRNIPVVIAQSWIEPRTMQIDLVDSNAMRHEARLRVTAIRSVYEGSIWRSGKRRWVRCREA